MVPTLLSDFNPFVGLLLHAPPRHTILHHAAYRAAPCPRHNHNHNHNHEHPRYVHLSQYIAKLLLASSSSSQTSTTEVDDAMVGSNKHNLTKEECKQLVMMGKMCFDGAEVSAGAVPTDLSIRKKMVWVVWGQPQFDMHLCLPLCLQPQAYAACPLTHCDCRRRKCTTGSAYQTYGKATAAAAGTTPTTKRTTPQDTPCPRRQKQ